MTKLIIDVMAVIVGVSMMALMIFCLLARDENFYPSDGGLHGCIAQEMDSLRASDEDAYNRAYEWCLEE